MALEVFQEVHDLSVITYQEFRAGSVLTVGIWTLEQIALQVFEAVQNL